MASSMEAKPHEHPGKEKKEAKKQMNLHERASLARLEAAKRTIG